MLRQRIKKAKPGTAAAGACVFPKYLGVVAAAVLTGRIFRSAAGGGGSYILGSAAQAASLHSSSVVNKEKCCALLAALHSDALPTKFSRGRIGRARLRRATFVCLQDGDLPTSRPGGWCCSRCGWRTHVWIRNGTGWRRRWRRCCVQFRFEKFFSLQSILIIGI
jgi:hypothetical protein